MRIKPSKKELQKIKREYYLARKKRIAEARLSGIRLKLPERPWYPHWDAANTRCTNPNAINYKFYGGRGVTFELTVEDVKILWILDKADDQKRPSLDRIDSSKGYTFENCRFIELSKNSSRANKGKKRRKKNG